MPRCIGRPYQPYQKESNIRFMVLVYPGNQTGYGAGQLPDQALLADMGTFNEALVEAGVLLSGEGLQPSSTGARVHFPGHGHKSVTHGPFTGAREVIGGFWIWQVQSQEEALAWAQRAPMEEGAPLELRQGSAPADFGPEVEDHERKLREQLERRQHR
jgi:hypothetical protein